MTNQPHVALDAKALEALRNELEGEYGEKVIGKQTLYWLVTAYLAALSQNPGTSNTSGEAAGVTAFAWRLPENPKWHLEWAPWEPTNGGAGRIIVPLYAALEPRASDRGAVLIDLETLKWWRELVDLNPADLAPRLDDRIAAAIRKLSEVSHEH